MTVATAARRAGEGTLAVIGRHRLFATLLVLATLIRALVWVAFRPALFFYGDSYTYLGNSVGLTPNPVRPVAYPALLHLLLLGNDIAAVPAAQHLFGIATAVIAYALLRHFGAGPVLASAAAAPVLFDGYLIDIEQYVLAESMFVVLMMAGLALLVWWRRPSPAACAAAGALLGVAALTRTVGMVLLVPVLLYVLVRWMGMLRVALVTAGFLVPLIVYAFWFSATWGQFTVTKHDGYFLYGRVSTFADCSNWHVPPAQRYLCFHQPPSLRPGPNFYVWHRWSVPPYRSHPFALDAQLRSFAVAAIEHEPGAYASTILGDLAHYASFGHWTNSFDTPFRHWRFPTSFGHHRSLMERSIARHGGTLALDRRLATPLRAYQRIVFLPGTVMAAMLLAGLAAAAIGRRAPERRLRGEAMLFALAALLLPMTAAATTMFDYRYALPAIPPLCVGAGIAGLVTQDRLRAWRASRQAAQTPARPLLAEPQPGSDPIGV